MKMLAMLIGLSLGVAAWAQAPADPMKTGSAVTTVKVERMVAATGVKDREPVGEAATFDAGLFRVYCWSLVRAESVPAAIKHAWHLDGKKVSEIPLAINYARTRTWSSKAVRAGNWKVSAVTEAGEVLSSVSFTVTAAPAQ